jgi:transcriptional regulator with XRE-family HTH domain
MNTTLHQGLPFSTAAGEDRGVIQDIVRSYGIGEKIRALRREKKMGLVELGRHSGLSAALLSKIETGKLIPPLPTLLRIAMVFSVGLDYFFADDGRKNKVVVSKGDGSSDRVLIPEDPERKLEAELRSFASVPSQISAVRTGTAMLYLLSGGLTATVAGEQWELSEGDSMTFPLQLEHALRAAGDPARALVVLLP